MVKKYLKFLRKSTNEHGVHSPFVYKLVTECIYKKSPNAVVYKYKKYRNYLKKSTQLILVKEKKIKVSEKHGLLLNRLINYLNINSVLILGTSVGLKAAAICIHNLKVNLDIVESSKEKLNIATKQLESLAIQHQITTYNDSFNNVLPNLLSQKNYDLICFDTNCGKEAILTCFEICLKAKHNNSVFIFEDIYKSKEVEEAWQTIQNNEQVKVTVDLFKCGLVFFRREQEKEHFKIRF